MLEVAILNEGNLCQRYKEIISDSKNRFYFFQNFIDYELTIDRNEWRKMQYVSKDSLGKLHAYFEFRIDRTSNIIEDILIISLLDQKLSFMASKDLGDAVYRLFKMNGFRKMFFRYINENPAAKQYEKVIIDIAKCGTIVGVLKECKTLPDAKNYDIVIMDILQKPFIEWYEKRTNKIK